MKKPFDVYSTLDRKGFLTKSTPLCILAAQKMQHIQIYNAK